MHRRDVFGNIWKMSQKNRLSCVNICMIWETHLGGMKSYIDLLDQYEKYQGGFIWDYIDQALLVKDEITGREVLRYGGDFDDRPSDYEFSGNGIVFADRTEKPAMQEVKYYYGLQK